MTDDALPGSPVVAEVGAPEDTAGGPNVNEEFVCVPGCPDPEAGGGVMVIDGVLGG